MSKQYLILMSYSITGKSWVLETLPTEDYLLGSAGFAALNQIVARVDTGMHLGSSRRARVKH